MKNLFKSDRKERQDQINAVVAEAEREDRKERQRVPAAVSMDRGVDDLAMYAYMGAFFIPIF